MEILSLHGGIIRKYKWNASTMYNIGVALVNMRIYICR